MATSSDFALAIASIVIPILYAAFFQGSTILTRRRENLLSEYIEYLRIGKGAKFYAAFSASVVTPMIILAYFDFTNLNSNLNLFYLPSFSVIIIGALLSIFRRLYSVLFAFPVVLFLFFIFPIYDQYMGLFAIANVLLLILCLGNEFKGWGTKIVLRWHWMPMVLGFSAFGFQFLYSIFVMGLDSLPGNNSGLSRSVLANIYITFLAVYFTVFALSLPLGLRWLLKTIKFEILSLKIRKQSERFEVKVKSSGNTLTQGYLRSIDKALVVEKVDGELEIIPWDLTLKFSFRGTKEGHNKKIGIDEKRWQD